MRQFPDREAATLWLQAQQREARLSQPADAGTTLDEYAVQWFRQIQPTLRRATQRIYASYLNQHVLPALGSVPLRRLGRSQVKELLASLLRSGLAKKTVSNIRGVLHACLESALEDLPEVMTSNPAAFKSRRLSLTSSQAERRAKIKALTVPELRRFLIAARGGAHYQALRFLAGTGCRPGEALALQWQDLDLDAGHVLIRRSISEGREEPTKTGHERQVDLGPGLVEELRAWDAATKARALEAGAPRGPWVFSAGARPLRLRVLQDAFRAAGKLARIAAWHTPHHLRHTYASQALAAGESIYYVQRQLGHATIAMTVDLYGRWLPAGSQEAAARIEGAALGPVTSDVTSDVTSRAREGPSTRGRRR